MALGHMLALALLFSFLQPSLATAPTNGCGRPLPSKLAAGKTANFTLALSNSTDPPSDREYHVYIPPSYDKDNPTALLFSIHGRTENMMQQERVSKLSDPAFNPSAIAIYPQGLFKKGTHIRQWSGDPDSPPSINDTVFIAELLDHFQARYCIDPARVYATGKSNGGGMVDRLACDPSMSFRIAAFAPVSGAFYPLYQEPCSSGRHPIPMLEFHGGNDSVIHYDGGPDGSNRGDTLAIPTFLAQWADRDCPPVGVGNVTVQLTNDEGKNYANKTTWSCGAGEGIVTHYFSSFLGHTWPNEMNAGYEATRVILEFFGNHSLDTEARVTGSEKDEL